MKNGARALPAAIATELVALYSAGKWAQLVTAAGRVTARYPRHLLGWQAAGKALLQLGQVPEAIDMLSRVVKLAPDEADGYNDLGNALHAIGRTDEAIGQLPPRRGIKSALARSAFQSWPYPLRSRPVRGSRGLLPARDRHRSWLQPIAHNNLGNALRETGPLDRSRGQLPPVARAQAGLPGSSHQSGQHTGRPRPLGLKRNQAIGWRSRCTRIQASRINALGRLLSRLSRG